MKKTVLTAGRSSGPRKSRRHTFRRRATEEDIANVIFAAATGGTNQLRSVATEDIKPWVTARREGCESEYTQCRPERSSTGSTDTKEKQP